MSVAEGGTAQWAGTQIQARDYYYFYKGMSESLEQERAQLSQLKDVMDPTMFKFAVGTKFGGTMGAKWEMKQPHLVEIAKIVGREREALNPKVVFQAVVLT